MVSFDKDVLKQVIVRPPCENALSEEAEVAGIPSTFLKSNNIKYNFSKLYKDARGPTNIYEALRGFANLN